MGGSPNGSPLIGGRVRGYRITLKLHDLEATSPCGSVATTLTVCRPKPSRLLT